MTTLALDWNATRVRAVVGAAGDCPLPVPLEPPLIDLPLAISLGKSAPEVGAAALRQCRSAAHLVCQAFLPHLTEQPGQGPRWRAGWSAAGELDARAACDLVWRKLLPLARSASEGDGKGIVLTVPGYLLPSQAGTLRRLGENARLSVLGSAPTTLTAALSGHVELFWQRSVLVLDVDDHALTLGWVKAVADKAHLVESRSFTQLGLRFWNERLLNALSDLCVRQHRRDPRDAPMAEQSLYDQLEPLTDAALKYQPIHLAVQGQQWFKHFLVHPEQTVQFCAPLVRQAAHEAEHLLLGWPASELPRCILLTHQAGRVPGLVEALRKLVLPSSSAETRLPLSNETTYHEDDFGEELMFPDTEERGGVMVLPPEAPARSAHGLAELFRQGALAAGHLETMAPLPAQPPVDSGPPRLHFLGRDYLLGESSFTLGSEVGCQLQFDRREYPDVSARHCEVVCDQRVFTLHNSCREGTLVNDYLVSGSIVLHAGDRVRLGLGGPLLRFLGTKSAGRRPQSVGSLKRY
jgi:hypothetical protein